MCNDSCCCIVCAGSRGRTPDGMVIVRWRYVPCAEIIHWYLWAFTGSQKTEQIWHEGGCCLDIFRIHVDADSIQWFLIRLRRRANSAFSVQVHSLSIVYGTWTAQRFIWRTHVVGRMLHTVGIQNQLTVILQAARFRCLHHRCVEDDLFRCNHHSSLLLGGFA